MHPLVERALKGELLLGAWITIESPDVAEALSMIPLDFLVIDMEHGPLGVREAERILMAIKPPTAGIVRVPWNSHVEIKRALDIGADGILVPMVNSREEALAVERAVLYPPRGIRGFGPRRASRYGNLDLRKYYESYLDSLIVMVQIETAEAVERQAEIEEVGTISGVLVGPNDLSASMGIYGRYEERAFKEAVARVARSSRKPLRAIFVPNLAMAREAISMGYNMIALSADIFVLVDAYRKMVAELRGRG